MTWHTIFKKFKGLGENTTSSFRPSFFASQDATAGCSHRRFCHPLTGRLRSFPSTPLSLGPRQCPMMKLSSDNGSITPRRAAARRPSVPHRTPSSPCPCPRAGGAGPRREGEEERASRRTVYLPWRLFMLADGHLCCTHIALRGRSRDPRGAPLLSPWPGHRRVMANALRIKCILSLTVRWHRCLGDIEITPFPPPPLRSPLAPPSRRLDTSSFLACLVVVASLDCHHLLKLRCILAAGESLYSESQREAYRNGNSNRW